jgi:hypothetical protein
LSTNRPAQRLPLLLANLRWCTLRRQMANDFHSRNRLGEMGGRGAGACTASPHKHRRPAGQQKSSLQSAPAICCKAHRVRAPEDVELHQPPMEPRLAPELGQREELCRRRRPWPRRGSRHARRAERNEHRQLGQLAVCGDLHARVRVSVTAALCLAAAWGFPSAYGGCTCNTASARHHSM